MDGFEEAPVQVGERGCYIPGVDDQESNWPPTQLSTVC